MYRPRTIRIAPDSWGNIFLGGWVDPHEVTALTALISPERLEPYLKHYQGRPDLAARLYMWNIELSAAFWGPLSVMEVVLRNSIHNAMREGRRDDWWNTPHVRLEEREAGSLKSTLDKLQRSGNSEPTSGDVVGSTNFGFWVGMLGAGRARHALYDYETAFWQPRLKKAFPFRGQAGRKQIHANFNAIRLFRNRVAHHEPIFIRDHARTRDLIIDCVALIDPSVAEFIEKTDRIQEVLERQEVAITHGVCTF